MPRAWITLSIFNSFAVAITALFSLFPLALPHSPPPAFDTYKILVAPPPSFYPRVIQDPSSSTWLAVYEAPALSLRSLTYAIASTSQAPIVFRAISTIFASSETNVDVANPHLIRLPPPSRQSSPPQPGLLLCVFRHHSMSPQPPVYRIQTASSRDNGVTWAPPVDVISGPHGVWEPFLLAVGGHVLVLYALELKNGGEQVIAVMRSDDEGRSCWVPLSHIYTKSSRNGMPGAVLIPMGSSSDPPTMGGNYSIVVIHEGFIENKWDNYSVHSAVSHDGGASWQQRSNVFVPAQGFNAGSPQIALCPDTSTVIAVYMCDEQSLSLPSPTSPPSTLMPQSPLQAWPGGAHIQATYGSWIGHDVAWANRSITVVAEPSFWPSMLTAATSASPPSARALPVYQDAAGSSWILGQDLCQSAK